MGAKRQARKVIRFTAWCSMLIWICAISYCSSLCLLGCNPAGAGQTVEYTHEGCEGHPQDSDSGCKDPFCDSVDSAYVSFDQFTFLKAHVPVALDCIVAHMQEAPVDAFVLRQPPLALPLSPPVVSLDTWNQCNAPPALA